MSYQQTDALAVEAGQRGTRQLRSVEPCYGDENWYSYGEVEVHFLPRQ